MTANDVLTDCHECHLTLRGPVGPDLIARCPRCGSQVQRRKPDSIARTWAFVITAVILYFPANLFPVMEMTSLGAGKKTTIMSGVLFLLNHGVWPLALVVFVASVLVPLLKLVALAYLLLSVQWGSRKRMADRTRIYRITEAVGRWSMVDIYVIAIMVALLGAGGITTVKAEPGAMFFAAVVVLTMIAAKSFDPRLIWDRAGANDE